MFGRIDVRFASQLKRSLFNELKYYSRVHEVSVISGMVNAVLEELKKYDAVSVASVDIVIGDMTQLGDEQLLFAYEIVTRDTMLEGSVLNIEHEPVNVACKECGYDGPVVMLDAGDFSSHAIPVLSCPECGGRVKVTSGQSCCVRSLELEEKE